MMQCRIARHYHPHCCTVNTTPASTHQRACHSYCIAIFVYVIIAVQLLRQSGAQQMALVLV